MTCPYINPSIQQCLNCPLSDCTRLLTDSAVYSREWRKKNPDKARRIDANKRAKFSAEKKKSELERLENWKKKHPARVRKRIIINNRKWRKAHREQERERSKMNYQKRKERQVG
jgi:hypothetical protein